MKLNEALSERIIFGVMVIMGYFLMVGTGAWFLRNDINALALIRDAILPMATLLGVVINAVFKTDRVEKVAANTAAVLAAKSPDLSSSTVSTPGVDVNGPDTADASPLAGLVKKST